MRTAALAALLAGLASCSREPSPSTAPRDAGKPAAAAPTEDDFKKKLSPEEYYVCRMKGTEKPFDNKYWNHKADGAYACVACGAELFDSRTKFNSGTGWPSFSDMARKENVKTSVDTLLGYPRTEVLCAKCDSHLGHVFDDGPKPTGLRYCINSAALRFKPAEKP